MVFTFEFSSLCLYSVDILSVLDICPCSTQHTRDNAFSSLSVPASVLLLAYAKDTPMPWR